MKRTKKKVVKKKIKSYGAPRPIEELIDRDNEDFFDAWTKLRDFTESLGEQRIYTSAKAIMFSRRVCHAFVRPKKSYLELCFFLDHPLKNAGVKVQKLSKVKYAHTFRLVHSDQVEEPLTDWLRQAFQLSE